MGLELMDMCDEVGAFGFDITEGMKFELDHAKKTRKACKALRYGFQSRECQKPFLWMKSGCQIQRHHQKSEGVETGRSAMSAVNVRYGLYLGDRLMVTAGKKRREQP